MGKHKKRRQDELFCSWTLPQFPVEVRARFMGLASLLGKHPSVLVEEAVLEWMMNHADDITNIVMAEYEYLKKEEVEND